MRSEMKVIKYRARVVQRVYTFCAVDAQMQNTKDTRPICARVTTVYKIRLINYFLFLTPRYAHTRT